MIPRNGFIIASLTTGCVGGAIAGLWGKFWVSQGIGFPEYVIPVGIVSGFLSCFLVVEWYLRFMANKSWPWAILFGLLFAGLAGTIAGMVTIFSSMLEDIGRQDFEARYLVVVINFGLMIGGGTGVLVGLVSSLVFGAIRGLSAVKRG
jgi:hypothetical protein